MIKLYFLSLLFMLAGVINGFGCKDFGVTMNTELIVGGTPSIDYEVQKGSAGMNEFILSKSGNLTYQRQQFVRPILLKGTASSFHIYDNKLACLAVVVSQQGGNTASTFYIVNRNTLASTSVTLPGKSYFFWGPEGDSLFILTDYRGHSFSIINMLTGRIRHGSRLRNGKNLLYAESEPRRDRNSNILIFYAKEGCNSFQDEKCYLKPEFKSYAVRINIQAMAVTISPN